MNRIREKIELRDLPLVMATFKKMDEGGNGCIDTEQFRVILKTKLGVGDVDDSVGEA